MKAIDPLTLVFTAGVLAFMASGFLFMLRKSLSHRVRGIRPWAYAMLLGWVSTALRWEQGMIPDFFSLVVSNGLLMLAMGLMLYGLRRFNGQPPRMTPVWLLGGAVLGFIAWFSLVDDVFYLRIAATCVYALIVFPLSAHATFVGRSVFRSPARLLIGWIYIGISLVMLLELVDALMLGPALQGFERGSLANLLFVGSFNVLVVGLFFGFVMLVNDRLRDELASLANTDALTLTLNRRAFMEEASRVLARERRENRPSSLLMLDLDHFKLVNDRFGHVRGDHVLQRFAERVRERLRAGDVFGRYGGEEFLVLLPGAGAEDGLVLAEKLRSRVAEAALGTDGEQAELTVSVGLAADMGEGGIPELIEAADWALYRAKHRGRNRVVMFGDPEAGMPSEAE
jgi:diguanylate cyclase (GGDEF)-like protein